MFIINFAQLFIGCKNISQPVQYAISVLKTIVNKEQ